MINQPHGLSIQVHNSVSVSNIRVQFFHVLFCHQHFSRIRAQDPFFIFSASCDPCMGEFWTAPLCRRTRGDRARSPRVTLAYGALARKKNSCTDKAEAELQWCIGLYIQANIHGSSHVPATHLTSTSSCRRHWLNFISVPHGRLFFKNHPAKFSLRDPWGKPLLLCETFFLSFFLWCRIPFNQRVEFLLKTDSRYPNSFGTVLLHSSSFSSRYLFVCLFAVIKSLLGNCFFICLLL